mgnify:CR=1 FL=1
MAGEEQRVGRVTEPRPCRPMAIDPKSSMVGREPTESSEISRVELMRNRPPRSYFHYLRLLPLPKSSAGDFDSSSLTPRENSLTV